MTPVNNGQLLYTFSSQQWCTILRLIKWHVLPLVESNLYFVSAKNSPVFSHCTYTYTHTHVPKHITCAHTQCQFCVPGWSTGVTWYRWCWRPVVSRPSRSRCKWHGLVILITLPRYTEALLYTYFVHILKRRYTRHGKTLKWTTAQSSRLESGEQILSSDF